MGGYGSSRWNDHTPKRTVESALTLNVMRLIGRIIPREAVALGAAYRTKIVWRMNGQEIGWISCELRHASGTPYLVLSYTTGGKQQLYNVGLVSTPCQFGGMRLWFQCPHCGRRAGCIFLPPGEHIFACRHCHGLTYTSAKEAHASDRNPLVGPLVTMINLQRRIDVLQGKARRCHPRSRNRQHIEARLRQLYRRALVSRAGEALMEYGL